MKVSPFLVLFSCLQSATPKEFVATHEWQALDPEDTIPAGLHVRMDMTTGERFAKIASDDADSDLITSDNVEKWNKMKEAGVFTETDSPSVVIDGVDLSKSRALSISNIDDSTSAENKTSSFVPSKPKYDYELMMRVFERIPSDERPLLPDRDKLPDHEWKEKMSEIWEERQAYIEDAMKKLVDTPDVLETLVKTLAASETSPEVVEDSLADLEDLLYDVDIARDFHLFGGWTQLTKMLVDASSPQGFRSQAAHAMGIAVKNHAEFADWALETSSVSSRPMIDLVLDIFAEEDVTVQLKGKAIYLLSALLRGNLDAQKHLFSSDAQVNAFHSILNEANSRIQSKMLTLASDLATEHEFNEIADEQIVSGVTGKLYCDAALRLLSNTRNPSEQEPALLTLKSKFCFNPVPTSIIELNKLKLTFGSVTKGWKDDGDLDESWREELFDSVNNVLSKLKLGHTEL